MTVRGYNPPMMIADISQQDLVYIVLILGIVALVLFIVRRF